MEVHSYFWAHKKAGWILKLIMTDPYNVDRVVFANVVFIFRLIVVVFLSIIWTLQHSILLFLVSMV